MEHVPDPDVHETAYPKLGERFNQALRYAAEKHRLQIRKGTGDVPYLSHLLSVAALVLESGGDEDLAIAALLHDAAEDQGGQAVLIEIRNTFGPRVADIVDGCTDTYDVPKPDWCVRKLNYIAHVRDVADLGTCLVSAADKVHNARSIVTDCHAEGDDAFNRFKGRRGQEKNPRDRKDRTIWYYRELVEAFRAAAERNRVDDGGSDAFAGLVRLTDEFERVVNELESLAGKVDYDPCRG